MLNDLYIDLQYCKAYGIIIIIIINALWLLSST
jgi:hypothetical protein